MTSLKKEKLHIETWGCQMNVADSELAASLLSEKYELCEDVSKANLIILNTCHIREKAFHKVTSRLGVLASYKQKNPDLMIAVAGCSAQAEGKKLLKNSNIDLLVGPARIKELPALVKKAREERGKVSALGFPKKDEAEHELDKFSYPTLSSARNEISRFVTIQQGCDNYCTFCIVPFTRGKEISVTPKTIFEQAKAFVEGGAKEITLLGQNVNSYGLDLVKQEKLKASNEGPFADLLRLVASIPGLESLRFTTSNPHDFTKPIPTLFKEHPVMGEYLHLPVQSGSNKTLKIMKRKVTREEFHERVKWLREASPEISLSTDLIVGFPGETEEDFEETISLVKEVRFSFAYAFKYSPRKHTPAARFKDQIPEEVKTARLRKLNEALDEITLEENAKEVGKTRKVLFLYESKKEKGTYYGRSRQFKLVRVKSGRNLIGKNLDVEITKSSKIALEGILA